MGRNLSSLGVQIQPGKGSRLSCLKRLKGDVGSGWDGPGAGRGSFEIHTCLLSSPSKMKIQSPSCTGKLGQ